MKAWCLAGPPSAKFVAKMEDVLSVYARPYDPQRPVVCFDETNKTLHATPRGQLPAAPGQPTREDYEYDRAGRANLFLAVEPLQGQRYVQVTDRRTHRDCAEFLRYLADDVYPTAAQIVLVSDNLNTHSPACLYEHFAPAEARRLAQRFEWHYTPEHGSWLNIAEIELSVLSRQCLNRRLPDQVTLRGEVAAWVQARNAASGKIDWHFTTDQARIKLKRLYPTLVTKNSS